MRVRGNEIIELLNVVTLQCLDDYFSFACVARVDEHRFSGRRRDEYRISVDWANVKDANSEFASRSGRRLVAQPRSNEFPVRGAGGDEYHEDHCNRTTAPSSSSSHSNLKAIHRLHRGDSTAIGQLKVNLPSHRQKLNLHSPGTNNLRNLWINFPPRRIRARAPTAFSPRG